MKKNSFIVLIALLALSLSSVEAFAQSKEQRLRTLKLAAQTHFPPSFSVSTARLLTGIDTAKAYADLDYLLKTGYGDMFWMYGCAGLYFSCKDILPESYKQRIRWCWKHQTSYRGDTDNHFLMYYGSLLLFAEEWDSLPASEWFLGRSSAEIRKEAKEWIEHWLHETVQSGQNEFDSPRYLYYYLTPLILLSAYSTDSVIRHDCSVMIDLLVAEYSSLSLDGAYAGAHSRQSSDAALQPYNAECLAYWDYFFTDTLIHRIPDVAFAAASPYELSDIIKKNILSKEEPYEVVQTVRTRKRLRNEAPATIPVKKYTYMTRDYALGSIQGRLVQPIQQQSWSLLLRSDSAYSCITGLHPHYSAAELATFFPEEPSFMLEKIEGVKHGYTSEEKWEGYSPYETIWQRRNQLKCSYDIPASAPYHHVDLFFPDWGKITDCDSTVWNRFVVNYDSVIVSLSSATDFSISKELGGYRLRLTLSKGKTTYWLSVRSNKKVVHSDYDPAMFSGSSVYSTDLCDGWHINSPLIRWPIGKTQGVLLAGDGSKMPIALYSPVKAKPKKKKRSRN